MKTFVQLATLFCFASPAVGSDVWADLDYRPHDHLGTHSCTSVSCHGSTEPRSLPGGPSLQEHLHWLGGEVSFLDGRRHYDPRAWLKKHQADPHALAGQRIFEPRFQEVLKRASHLPEGQVDPQVYAKCAKCHDPLHFAEPFDGQTLTPALSQRARETSFERGIGCESCHGGAKNWLAAHYQRGISRDELSKRGMVDTKNVLTQARLCASCHVGSADQDMNHDMIAAGHPPLRFEMASHQALIERKHWDDAPRRLAEPNYELQLWAAGRIASADAALALLEGRAAKRVATDETRMDTDRRGASWPEFAESNCFSCHQRLRPAISDPPDASKVLLASFGVPTWQTWNIALVAPLISAQTRVENELPSPIPSWEISLAEIRDRMGRSLVPPADVVARAAAKARMALREQVRVSLTGDILGSDGAPLGVAAVVQAISDSRRDARPTWEQCCHELAAVLAAERAVRDNATPNEQRLAACATIRLRLKQLARSLRFTSETFEWPAADIVSLEDISVELKSLAAELQQLDRNKY